ncbi:MAG: hypothetical protein JNJ73_19760 [Hyphomonadaceae bacterium]|nr:hypothetical protein [Hyphomonadaceae bacterium]
MLAVVIAILTPVAFLRCLAIGVRRALPAVAGLGAASYAHTLGVNVLNALGSGLIVVAFCIWFLDQAARSALRPFSIAAECMAAASAIAVLAYACLSSAGVADWRLFVLTGLAAACASLHLLRFRTDI